MRLASSRPIVGLILHQNLRLIPNECLLVPALFVGTA